MKTILTTFILLLTSNFYGQTKTIKVKKTVTQETMTSVVTIAGFYHGNITVSKLIAAKKMHISNNTENWKIISYEFIVGGGKISSFTQLGDSLTSNIIEELYKRNLDNGSKIKPLILISNIKAINSKNDTMFLNPIQLKLEKE
ncbi:MAG: hypothetical protein KF900_00290 [Bacteroidetes bacterium]|nr:hypothetical protein [Bacteroidota bacterium]